MTTSQKNISRFFLILLLIIWLFAIFFTFGYTYRNISLFWTDASFAFERQVDFRCYYGITLMLRHSNPRLYDENQNFFYQVLTGLRSGSAVKITYPPSFYYLFLPFTLLDLNFAARVWLWVQTALIPLCAYLMVLILAPVSMKFWQKLCCFAAASLSILSFCPTLDDIVSGQINLFLLVLLLISFILIQKKLDIPAGLLLGFIFCLKFISIFIISYYAIKRRWVVVFSALAIILAVNLRIISLFGFQIFTDYLSTLPHSLSFYWTWINQSIPAKILQLTEIWGINYHGLMDHIRVGFSIFSFIVLALVFVIIIKTKETVGSQKESEDNHFLDFALITVTTIVVSPLTWTFHYVWLVMPLGILVKKVFQGYQFSSNKIIQRLILTILLMVYLYMSTLAGMSSEHFHDLSMKLIYYGLPLISSIILWILMLFIKLKSSKFQNQEKPAFSEKITQ